jgi:hypothetical protein
MTWVNIKKVESLIETRIMILINEYPGRGRRLDVVKRYFNAFQEPEMTKLQNEIPGWFQLSGHKRIARVNKIIARLIKEGRARVEMEDNGNYYRVEYLVPLNVLDKLVFALEQKELEKPNEDALV